MSAACVRRVVITRGSKAEIAHSLRHPRGWGRADRDAPVEDEVLAFPHSASVWPLLKEAVDPTVQLADSGRPDLRPQDVGRRPLAAYPTRAVHQHVAPLQLAPVLAAPRREVAELPRRRRQRAVEAADARLVGVAAVDEHRVAAAAFPRRRHGHDALPELRGREPGAAVPEAQLRGRYAQRHDLRALLHQQAVEVARPALAALELHGAEPRVRRELPLVRGARRAVAAQRGVDALAGDAHATRQPERVAKVALLHGQRRGVGHVAVMVEQQHRHGPGPPAVWQPKPPCRLAARPCTTPPQRPTSAPAAPPSPLSLACPSPRPRHPTLPLWAGLLAQPPSQASCSPPLPS